MSDDSPTTSQRNETQLAVVVTQMDSIKSNLADLKENTKNDLNEIKSAVKELTSTIDDSYVTKNEFAPIKALVYGFVTMILIAVASAIIYLVIQRP